MFLDVVPTPEPVAAQSALFGAEPEVPPQETTQNWRRG